MHIHTHTSDLYKVCIHSRHLDPAHHNLEACQEHSRGGRRQLHKIRAEIEGIEGKPSIKSAVHEEQHEEISGRSPSIFNIKTETSAEHQTRMNSRICDSFRGSESSVLLFIKLDSQTSK